MCRNRQGIRLRLDTYTRVCLTVIAVLLTVVVLGLWAERVPTAGQAVGGTVTGIPDAGQQRDRMAKEQEKTTAKIEQLVQLFESGKAKVQVMQPPKEAPKDRDAK